MKRYRYLITCPAGLESILLSELRCLDPGVLVDTTLSGLVSFASALGPEAVLGLRGASNAFSILSEQGFPSVAKSGGGMPDPAKLLMKALASEKTFRDLGPGLAGKGFRLMLSSENALVSVDRQVLARAEERISGETGMQSSRSKAEAEFWLLARNEGRAYFCLRLSARRSTERDLEKGELKPEIAHAMCALAGPVAGERLLDPFCGSGAIALECAAGFPGVEMLSCDVDGEKAARVASRIRGRAGLSARQADFFDSDSFPRASFSAIVTDPPWGAFSALDDPAEFYRGFARRCSELLMDGGRLVALSGAKEDCLSGLAAEPSFEILRRIDLLVSGKKALLCLCRKRGGD
jgi:23S rRNA G2445 N2-methylase RlmL